MPSKRHVRFQNGQITLAGWFYTPNTPTAAPCIIMAHGFSALKEHYLDSFARVFAQAGLCVLAYDNRHFGESDGTPRQEVNTAEQQSDMRQAITYAQQQAEVNGERIGLWGTSFSAGIALAVAAEDARVHCVVAQVPFIGGYLSSLKTSHPKKWQTLNHQYAAEEKALKAGHSPTTIAVVLDKETRSAVIKLPEATAFFTCVPTWKNQVTLLSLKQAGEFDVTDDINRITRTPVLFIVANRDSVNATTLALSAYEQLKTTKQLVMIDGEHFAPYVEQFDLCSKRACDWFRQHLMTSG
ncbi:MAG: hypothetical protein A3E85_01660 [Gammaproteobacteria bacterium RIFCSPHIGHO2_12_FULL_45_12]|nr:MAG: hypothetical protein A3E85_01660 [Gammaproteobacteria bacterium RIFCSPHIGHO2_12_FULL_45_12]